MTQKSEENMKIGEKSKTEKAGIIGKAPALSVWALRLLPKIFKKDREA